MPWPQNILALSFGTAWAMLACGSAILYAVCLPPARAEPRIQPPMHVATWDVSHAERATRAREKKSEGPSWRHTFGSERLDRRKKRNRVFNLSSDVVLLQGVRNMRTLRRMFPRRDWNIVLSRRHLMDIPRLGRLPSDLRSFDVSVHDQMLGRSVVAIAVRYGSHMRVRAVRHYRRARDNTQNLPNLDGQATAVLLTYFGATVWLVSAEVANGCADGAPSCQPLHDVHSWLRAVRDDDTNHTPTIVGYTVKTHLDSQITKSPPTMPCGSLTTADMNPTRQTQPLLGKTHRLTRDALGCITLATAKLHKH